MTDLRLVNLLGALSLALADAQIRAVRDATDLGSAACAAINTLAQYPDQTIRQLASVAGLSHSVMVRTVEGLVKDGLATKSAGTDRREALVRLSAEGEALRDRLAQARKAALVGALKCVSAERQEAFLDTIGDMLSAMTETRPQSDHICRLCDEAACGSDCPVEQKVRQTEATSVKVSRR